MISKQNSKPFRVKFAVGISKTNKIDMKYKKEWEDVFGLIGDPSGDVAKYIFGQDPSIDRTIVVNASSVSRAINQNTCFLVDNMPTSVYENGDYSFARKMPEYNGEIVIGLTKIQSIDIPKLYFVYNNEILYYQLNFDKNTLKGYVDINERIPFKEGDYVWTREPADSSSTKNRLKFVSKSKVGLDRHFKNFMELTFVKE